MHFFHLQNSPDPQNVQQNQKIPQTLKTGWGRAGMILGGSIGCYLPGVGSCAGVTSNNARTGILQAAFCSSKIPDAGVTDIQRRASI